MSKSETAIGSNTIVHVHAFYELWNSTIINTDDPKSWPLFFNLPVFPALSCLLCHLQFLSTLDLWLLDLLNASIQKLAGPCRCRRCINNPAVNITCLSTSTNLTCSAFFSSVFILFFLTWAPLFWQSWQLPTELCGQWALSPFSLYIKASTRQMGWYMRVGRKQEEERVQD